MSSTSEGPLRIVVVVKTSHGGLWLLPHVDELRARGHDVAVVLPGERGRLTDELEARAVEVVASSFDFRFRPRPATLGGLVGLRRQIRDLRPDVVHYHLYASALAARFAMAGSRVPRVHMVAGPLYLESPLIRWVERFLVRLDTVTICGSAFTARLYRSLGRSADATPSIPYGLDCERFRPGAQEVRQEVRRQLGLGPDAFVAIMVALVYAPKNAVHRGRGIKGHDLILEAWREFAADRPDVHLLLVGAGFDQAGEVHRRELVELFLPSDMASSVTWLDTVTDVRPYYAAADVSVSPSRSENHGAAVEAGAMGLPSIVTEVGGLPEAVGPGSGWVIPPEDATALREALAVAHGPARSELGARGARARDHVVTHFGRDRCARAIADVIEAAARRSVISVFAEARLGRDETGRWAAIDRVNGDEAWQRYRTPALGSQRPVRAVVRADRQPGSGSVPLSDTVDVEALPYYVGLPGLVRVVVPLVVGIWRRVADAERIVLRLPGVIGSVAATACRIRRRRYAVEVVGDPVDVLASGVLGRGGRVGRRLAAAHLRWVVAGAEASLFVTRTELQRRYPPRTNTPTIGMSRVLLRDDDFVASGRRRIGGHEIVTVGSQEQRYKGHDVLLRAIRVLRDDGLDVSATIVGGGRFHSELRQQAEELDLTASVTFTGSVLDRSRVRALLDAATLFVLPSRAEGTPRALLEAMARALPAVGTAVGGTRELLVPRALVPPDDVDALAGAIRAVLEDTERWEAESRRNLETARTFHSSVLEPRFEGWLRSVPPAAS